MSDNKSLSVLITALICLAGLVNPTPLHAGSPSDSTYEVVAYIGGGFSRYLLAPGGPPDIPINVSKMGLAGTVRVMWHPNHLVRLGIETGWTKFYSYTLQTQPSGQVYLSGVPLLIVWSMRVLNVDLFWGSGYYLLNSNLDYQGTVNVKTWSLGWMVAASYTHPLSDKLGVAGEVKWMNATEHELANLTAQVQLVWRVFEW
jgi:hypothetical protein